LPHLDLVLKSSLSMAFGEEGSEWEFPEGLSEYLLNSDSSSMNLLTLCSFLMLELLGLESVVFIKCILVSLAGVF